MQKAIAFVALLFLVAGGFLVAGVHLLLGVSWAFIATGLLLFAAAIYLRMGLRPNG